MQKFLAAFLAVLAVALFAGVTVKPHHWRPVADAAAADTLVPCYGAPADYVAANDDKDGVIDGKVSYPEPRTFYEFQGQVGAPGTTQHFEAEHVHVGGCFPYGETIKQPNTARTLDLRFIFYNLSHYNISKFSINWVATGSSGHGSTATAAQLAEMQAAADASDGQKVVKVFQSFTGKDAIGQNCRRTVKLTMTLLSDGQAVVNDWETGGQFATIIDYPENTTTCTPEGATADDVLRGRDWVPDPNMGYIYAGIRPNATASQASTPVPTPWDVTFTASGMKGAAYVDPMFMMTGGPDDPGIWSHDLGQLDVGSVPDTIPTDTFPAGDHKLVWIGTRGPDSTTGITHASVLVMPFTVAGACCSCCC